MGKSKEGYDTMPMLEGETGKEEKINRMIYDMSPSPDYRHGMVNNNVNTIIGNFLILK